MVQSHSPPSPVLICANALDLNFSNLSTFRMKFASNNKHLWKRKNQNFKPRIRKINGKTYRRSELGISFHQTLQNILKFDMKIAGKNPFTFFVC